jgi:hypothetical protein
LETLRVRMQMEFPRILKHLNENYLEILFMTLFVYMTPLDVASRLFELFLLDGEKVLLTIIMKMVELKQRKILSLSDLDLQQYMLCGMVKECTNLYTLEKLLQ